MYQTDERETKWQNIDHGPTMVCAMQLVIIEQCLNPIITGTVKYQNYTLWEIVYAQYTDVGYHP